MLIIEDRNKDPIVNISRADFYILENGVSMGQRFIPFENIFKYGIKSNKIVYLKTLIEKEKKKFVSMDIILKTKNPCLLIKNIKNYMYYHIKYNKINEDILYYFYQQV